MYIIIYAKSIDFLKNNFLFLEDFMIRYNRDFR